jgi:rhodanese-related sulfurtransferase
MAEIKNVSPEETAELMKQGAVYVDVRSEPEFEAGHVPGSLNVPLLHRGPSGMVPNPEFMEVMQKSFGTGEKLVIGCRTGQRSLRAGEMLIAAGYGDVSNLGPGFEGKKDAFGRAIPGWKTLGLPVEDGRRAGQCYADVKERRKPG